MSTERERQNARDQNLVDMNKKLDLILELLQKKEVKIERKNSKKN